MPSRSHRFSAIAVVAAVVALLALLLGASGCSDRDPAGLEMARGNTDPVVFDDYYHDTYYQPFFQTHYTAVSLDSAFSYNGFAGDGARSLKFNVPPANSSLGIYTGGVLTSGGARDLADYNALTFWARCSKNISMDLLGFGNDNTGTSRYEASIGEVALGTNWTQVVIPIPDSGRLRGERGLFTLAEGLEPQYRDGYDIWFDDIKYQHVEGITDPRPFIPSSNKKYFVGSMISIAGTHTVFNVDGQDVTVNHMPGYFDFTVSDPGVARVEPEGIKILGQGTAAVTAALGEVPATGEVTIEAWPAPPAPAPAPAYPATDVVALFSDAYEGVHVDTWNPHWQYSTTEEGTYVLDGDNMRSYSSLNFVGIEFLGDKVDASQMTGFHMDVYAPFGSDFKLKFVAFNAGNSYLGETFDVVFDAGSDPAFVPGQWNSLDIPLDVISFKVPLDDPWSSIGQLVLSTSDATLVLLDNIYWYR